MHQLRLKVQLSRERNALFSSAFHPDVGAVAVGVAQLRTDCMVASSPRLTAASYPPAARQKDRERCCNRVRSLSHSQDREWYRHSFESVQP